MHHHDDNPDSPLPPPSSAAAAPHDEAALGAAPAPGAPPDYTIRAAPRISAPVWAQALRQAGSPAAAEADALYAIPPQYGLDPAFLLALYRHESSMGTAGLAKTTLSWGNNRRTKGRGVVKTIPGRGPFAHYRSHADALHDCCQILREDYADGGLGRGRLDTVRTIVPVWAPASDNNNPEAYIAAVIADIVRWEVLSGDVGTPDAAHYPNVRLNGFVMDVRQWRTVAAFRRHLAAHSYRATAPWARGVVVHHTVKPTPADWRGADSMLGLARFYRDTQGWQAGPHLFVVSGAPRVADDGIWQLSPLNVPGVHANAANAYGWGMEVCGLYDRHWWPLDIAALALGAAAALLDWAGLRAGDDTLWPHRSFNPVKSCPGDAISMPVVARGVAALQEGRS